MAEDLARNRAKQIFGAEHVNVQPHSGAQANTAVYFSTLEPGMGVGWSPPYPDPMFDPHKAIIELTEQVINEVAASGNVVIVGRGAGFVLHGRAGVFRVFLCAPEDVRVRVLMKRLGLGDAEIRRKMHETDANRAAYIHQLYKHDWCDPDEYDLIVNTGRIGYETTAEIILRGVAERPGQ